MGPIRPLKTEKTLGGIAISRFCAFRFGSFSEIISGAVLEAFWVQKGIQNRAKNDTKNKSKFEADLEAISAERTGLLDANGVLFLGTVP